MTFFVQFFILGLVSGGLYALLAAGVVLVYRGSGIVNFSHGALALVGAAVFDALRGPLNTTLAIFAGVIVAGAVGAGIQAGVMWPMRRSSPLVRVVATLALLTIATQAALLHYGTETIFEAPIFPTGAVHLGVAGATIGADRLIILGITIVLVIALWAIYRYTRYGIATTALSKNARAVASLGWSPWKLALGNWAMGGALAGLAGILLVPLTGFAPAALSLTVVPTLGAALLGGFSSFPLALLGAAIIGVLQAEVTWYVPGVDLSSAVPFLVIVVVLMVAGRSLPLRSHFAEALPRLGAGVVPKVWVVVGAAAVLLTLSWSGATWADAVTTGAVFGLICLSLVVLTGYAGQLSLAQFAVAGLGALGTAQVASRGVPFLLAVPIGVVGATAAGSLLALPALRIRGINLAVTTMAVAVLIGDTILGAPALTGGLAGLTLPDPKVFGLDVAATSHSVRYAIVCIIVFCALAMVVANIRRGASGRRLIAIRDNERAAASLGISVQRAKIFAFAVAAALAGFAGALMICQYAFADFTTFDVFNSINAVLLTVIGSVGYVSGAIIGGASATAGPVQSLVSHVVSISSQFLLISACLLLIVLYLHPDGIAEQMAHQIRWVTRHVRRLLPMRMGRAKAPVPASDVHVGLEDFTVTPAKLEFRACSINFGGVKALREVSLVVDPGEIVGVIGPNGAGKTTLVDVATGFHRRYGGAVVLNGESLDSFPAFERARRGLTRSFQSLELFDDLTVRENLLVATDGDSVRSYLTSLIRTTRSTMPQAALAAVAALELEDVLDRRPTALSYSQRRLVAIARALATGPSVLLLDEPAAGLDAVATTQLATLLRNVSRAWNLGILLIEHDVELVLSACDRVVVLNFGELLATGTPDEVRNDPDVVAAYLGASAIAVE